MQLSEMKLVEDNPSSLPTGNNSHTFIRPSSCLTASKPNMEETVTNPATATNMYKKFAVGSIAHPVALTQSIPADTSTCVPNVNEKDMEARIVKHRKEKLNHIIQPKYLHHNLWREHSFTQTTADWSEYASPLPRPPKSELDNPITTITTYLYSK